MTSGGQQAIDLVARTVLAPGDVAVIESPTFIGGLNSLHATGARVIGIPVDGDGLDVDLLEKVLASNEVKLCALQTACQNPTGADLSPERRERLARLAVERNFFVMEDGVYSDVRFEGYLAAGAAPGGARPRDLRQLALQDGRRRSAHRLDRRSRARARPPGHAQDGERLLHGRADPAHRGALARERRLRAPPPELAALLPRAPGRAAGRRSSATSPASTARRCLAVVTTCG